MGRSSSSGSSSSSRSSSSSSSSRSSSGGWNSSGRTQSSSSRSSSSSSYNSIGNNISREVSRGISRGISRSVSRGINNYVPNRRTYSNGGVSYGGYRNRSGNNISQYVILITIAIFVICIFSVFGSYYSGISKSTIERTPIQKGKEVEYIHDDLDWISNESRAEQGMKYFYDETGVQPVVLLKSEIDGDYHPNGDTIDLFLEDTYNELFDDESHMLLLLIDTGSDWGAWTYVGSTASTVVDAEAQEIILQYTSKWYNSDPAEVSEDEMISGIFKDSAKRIMSITKSPFTYVIIFAVVGGVIGIIGVIVLKQIKAKAKLAEESRRILEADLKGSEDI